METISTEYLSRGTNWLLISTLVYFLMNGAQVFETVVFVPKWTAHPPETFRLLTDKNGMGLKSFWILLHSLHEISFIIAIAFCWKIDPVRNWLVILFIVHFAVRVWTILYFAPGINAFQKLAETQVTLPDLATRTSTWQGLNYLRVAIFIAISIGLVPLCLRMIHLRTP